MTFYYILVGILALAFIAQHVVTSRRMKKLDEKIAWKKMVNDSINDFEKMQSEMRLENADKL